MSGEKQITGIESSTRADVPTAAINQDGLAPASNTPEAKNKFASQTGLSEDLDPLAVLASWEDEDRNRYYPLSGNWFLVRDGGNGAFRGTIYLTASQALAFRKY